MSLARRLMSASGGQTYRDLVIQDGPTGYWLLNETSGTSAFDQTSNAMTGTYTGTYTLGEPGIPGDPGGKAVLINGGYIDLLSPTPLRAARPITIEGWVYHTANPDAGASILTEAYAGDGNVRYTLNWHYPATGMNLGTFPGSWVYVQSNTSPPLNTWEHYAGVMTSSDMLVYINGVLKGSLANTTTLPAGNESFYIGRRWDMSNYVRGRVCHVAFYTKALTATQISAHYNKGAGL